MILKDGYVVQQGEPQHILLNPNDPYIEDFVSDINRARVLRVRSVMKPVNGYADFAGVVDADDTLENLIELSEGDTTRRYLVQRDGDDVGVLDMKALVRALVPQQSGDRGSVR